MKPSTHGHFTEQILKLHTDNCKNEHPQGQSNQGGGGGGGFGGNRFAPLQNQGGGGGRGRAGAFGGGKSIPATSSPMRTPKA